MKVMKEFDWAVSVTSGLNPGKNESFTSQIQQLTVKVDENHLIYLNGKTDFDECFKDQPTSHCSLLFDPRPVQNQ